MTRLLSEPITIRVRLSIYDSRNLIDVRTWVTADGELVPGKSSAADVRHLPRLRAALAKAEAKARELGLITNENDGGAQ